MDEKHLQAVTHCNCNKYGAGKWGLHFTANPTSRYQTCLGPKYSCPICTYNLWYDAYFDDMMFDLKKMNQ